MTDYSELKQFAKQFEAASKAAKPFMATVLEDIGEEFLDIVQDEIMRAENVDTRVLLSSFLKGSSDNIFELDVGALTLTIGTTVEYAHYVNRGHKQTPGRFIPGIWNGNGIFRYQPGAKTGMVLKAKKVKGSRYFDKSVRMLKKIINVRTEKLFDDFFNKYFKR